MSGEETENDLLVSAQLLPWTLTGEGLLLAGTCRATGVVDPEPCLVPDLDAVLLPGESRSLAAWLEDGEATGRTIADLPFPDGSVRCHFYCRKSGDGQRSGVAIPLTASPSRRVAESSGELSRVALVEDATQEAIRCARKGHRLACCVLRIPEVLKVQTALGSAVAELFLKEIALRLKHALERPVLIYELGMQAFAILWDVGTEGEGGLQALDRELNEIAKRTFSHPYDVDSMSLRAQSAIGYALFPDDALDISELLRAAEIASLLALASESRTTVLRCPQSALEENREKLLLAAQFYEALLSDQIRPHVQPIVQSGTGRWVGGEVLLRWHHPDLGMVPPDRFINLAEEYGYISDLTVMAIRKVGEWVRENRLEDLRFSFNISPVDFRVKELSRLVNEVGSQGLLERNQVVFEIVESTALDDMAEANEVVRSARSRGIRMALDDFGTGYSSINLLQSLDLDFVKIDRSFTNGIAGNERKKQLLEAISYASRAFNLAMVAEGVETEEDLKIVRSFNIEYIQGYYFSRPLTLEDYVRGYMDRGWEKAA